MSKIDFPYSSHLRLVDPIVNKVPDPRSIYGNDLVAWFRSDLGVTLDGSNNVSNWADQTGNGHDLQQGVAGSRPAFVASGGPLDGPFVDSGGGAAAFMQHTGTPVTRNAGNWSVFIIGSCQTSAAIKVYTTTLTTPAGCVQFAWRKTAAPDKLEAQQLALAAPTSITNTAPPDMLPFRTWECGICTMDGAGKRELYTAGEGATNYSTDSHAGNIGIQLGEGYIFRFGGTMYTNLAIAELGFVKRQTSISDANLMRVYLRSRGIPN